MLKRCSLSILFLIFLTVSVHAGSKQGSAARLAELQSEKLLTEAQVDVEKSKKKLRDVLPEPPKTNLSAKEVDLSKFYIWEVYGIDTDLVAVLYTPHGGLVRIRVGDLFTSTLRVYSINADAVYVKNTITGLITPIQFYADVPSRLMTSSGNMPSSTGAQPMPAKLVSPNSDVFSLLPPPAVK